MKSLALTLVILFGALSVAQATTQDNNKQEETVLIEENIEGQQPSEDKKPAEAN